MTQQPYYPSQPQVQQPYAPPTYPQQPQAPQPYPQQPVYAQPPVQQFPQAPAIPAQPLANGTLDDFYSQPSVGGGPSISWKGKPDGTTYVGVVARDVTSGDVVHDTDPQTKQPKYYRDGRPMYSMKIPLSRVQSPEFPEGEANLWIRGSLREELTRAMSEAGLTGSPVAGDVIQVTLVGRKPGQGAIPKNIFSIVYQRPGGAGAPVQGQAPQATEAPSPVAVAQPVPQQGQPYDQPQAQPVQQPYAQPQGQPQYGQVPQAQPVAQVQAVQQVQPQQGLQPAPGMTPEQAELLARITGGQPQAPQG